MIRQAARPQRVLTKFSPLDDLDQWRKNYANRVVAAGNPNLCRRRPERDDVPPAAGRVDRRAGIASPPRATSPLRAAYLQSGEIFALNLTISVQGAEDFVAQRRSLPLVVAQRSAPRRAAGMQLYP